MIGKPTSIKRVARRASIALMIGLMMTAWLFVMYLSAYFGSFWLAGRRYLSPDHFHLARNTVFYPIDNLNGSTLPTAPYVLATCVWCSRNGAGLEPIPYSELVASIKAAKASTKSVPQQTANQDPSN
jgi:hypothetical protein